MGKKYVRAQKARVGGYEETHQLEVLLPFVLVCSKEGLELRTMVDVQIAGGGAAATLLLGHIVDVVRGAAAEGVTAGFECDDEDEGCEGKTVVADETANEEIVALEETGLADEVDMLEEVDTIEGVEELEEAGELEELRVAVELEELDCEAANAEED